MAGNSQVLGGPFKQPLDDNTGVADIGNFKCKENEDNGWNSGSGNKEQILNKTGSMQSVINQGPLY
jgi:hypothetical protein